MFFAKPGEYAEAGLYGVGHLILLIMTVLAIILALWFTKDKKGIEVRKIIKITTVFIWVLEIIKIIFNIAIGNKNNPNTYVPLYFCSIVLYAGILSSFCDGKLKHIGDVFIATGAIIAGAIFLIYPNTSLVDYPVFHFISLQSFILHGSMIYLGIIVNITGYINIELKDIVYYSGLTILVSLMALVVNLIYDSNLMFISKDFLNSPVHLFYKFTGKWFTFFAVILQAILPFFTMYGILRRTKGA